MLAEILCHRNCYAIEFINLGGIGRLNLTFQVEMQLRITPESLKYTVL